MTSSDFTATLMRAPAARLYGDRHSGIHLPLAIGSALAFTLLAGCSGQGAIRSASAASADKVFSTEAARSDRAVARAEATVARAPRDVAARAELGRAYLAAGRFESAREALGDAMSLGDTSGRTALSLALAQIGSGQFRQAVALLDERRDDIPAGDLGLALALAGESSRGVAILVDAVRGGENTPKLRQNLAYAYALDGRWAEAKVMAAQDIPADQLDRRMAIWALSALPDRSRDRVAGLLGAPVRRDAGQPAALALHTEPAAPQKAEMAVAPEAELPAAVAAAPVPTVETNLAVQSAPVIAQAPQAPVVTEAVKAPVVATRHAPALASLVQAFGGREFQTHKFQPAATVVPAKRVHAIAAAMARPVAGGTHVVQLGAFASERNARRAWAIYTHQNPSLAAYRPVIVPAVIKGRQLWRVAAGGLADRFAANGLCGNLRAHGSACFAYALPARAMPIPAGPMQQAGAFQRARR